MYEQINIKNSKNIILHAYLYNNIMLHILILFIVLNE